MSTRSSNPAHLRAHQYATGRNLNARIDLHRRFTTAEVPLPVWLFERMAIPADGRVLELGCGTGDYWQEVADRVPPDWRLTLTDFSEGMVREARAATAGLRCSTEVCVVDAAAVPLRDDSVDVVLANHMLYHLPDLDGALREVRRVLRPDGVLHAATIGETHLHQLHELIRRCVPSPRTLHGAVHRFSIENGAAQLARSFPNVETETIDGELHVTEVEPVLAYVRSTGVARGLQREDLERIAAAVREEIDSNGALVLDTHNALFTCRARASG